MTVKELNENSHKMTDLGQIPSEWEIVELKQIANRITRKNKETISENVLTISAQYGLVSQTDFFNKKIASKNVEGYYVLEKNDFAYNKSYSKGYPMGAIKALELYDMGIVSSLYICFRFNTDLTAFEFIKQYFDSNLWFGEVEQIAQEGARNHGLLNVSVKEFFNIKVILPPLKEQQKIADILSTVDEQIENTDKLIDKTKELKKGLMQQLLTKGIGHTEFKQTELGEIPVEWRIKELNQVTKYVDYRGKTPPKQDSGVRLITAKNIKKGYIDYETSKEFINEDDYDSVMRRGKPCKGDVLFTTEAPLGNVAQVDNENIALAQRVIKFNGIDLLDNTFLKFYMLSEKFHYQLFKKATGSTVQGIQGKQLHKLLIAIPSLEEQQKITEILSTVDGQIKSYEQEKEKYSEVKKGLMQQLLIGKIRVTV